MQDVRKIKQLKSQISGLTADYETMKMEIGIRQRECAEKLNAIKMLEREVEKIEKCSNLRVSEHALIRYFERVKGYNIAEIEKQILSDSIVKLVEKLGGNGKYPNQGFSVVMKGHTVVTIVDT